MEFLECVSEALASYISPLGLVLGGMSAIPILFICLCINDPGAVFSIFLSAGNGRGR